jgi:hypothetical protein
VRAAWRTGAAEIAARRQIMSMQVVAAAKVSQQDRQSSKPQFHIKPSFFSVQETCDTYPAKYL